ncbi:MAG: bifunctional adenosylcobinamide kinase/adenosylcobinamide-phosphate guanylyltransferase [Chloroflexales bacterium]|nr:bifunctional adenosylcobinamide kinase/adenosylcobinamide-phosphate guanylyltransferase [Chloroflexales bacterium]
MSKIILFTGGSRSGKSTRAEEYAARLSDQVLYLATAEAGDDEMRARIAIHQARRPSSWTSREEPLAVATALADVAPGTVVLLECLSLLVNNLLFAHESDPAPTIAEAVAAILRVSHERDLTLIIVTSEVGLGTVPMSPIGRLYRDLLGSANQQVAAAATAVYLVVCGIPLELKALEAAYAQSTA